MADGSLAGARRRGVSFDRLLRSAVGSLILRPWFDDAALRVLANWYFPLSRAWAAALAADGSVERFCFSLARRPIATRLLPHVLSTVEMRKQILADVEARWEDAFFGGGHPSAEVEAARASAAGALMRLRGAFVGAHLRHPFPPLRFAVEPYPSVVRRHQHRLLAPDRAFAVAGGMPAIEVSQAFVSGSKVERWVRFPCPAPAIADQAWARVTSPSADCGRSAPTVIFAHGIAMETEYWGEVRMPLSSLTEAGVRIIRPEAPWHGRRRSRGSYGGEPILARGPAGLIDFFHAHVIELGLLTAWARLNGGGPVAVGGMSLGALTAQLLAVVAADWPAEMRPDALLLVAPSRSVVAVALEGSLTRALGVPHAIRKAGWTTADLAHFTPVLEPCREPLLDPQRIVVVLGETDDVTLATEGERLARDWRLPEENVFRCKAGHFSTSLGLSRNSAPLQRLSRILAGVGGC